MSAARQSCVLCEHQTFRVRLWLAGCATALTASMHWFHFLFAALNTAPASLLCPRVHWQLLAELVYVIIRVPSDSHRPAKVAGSRLRKVFGGQLFPHAAQRKALPALRGSCLAAWAY